MAIFDHLDRALRWLREGRRLRQYQVAEAAGITKAMLSAYETGKQKPSLETLEKILLGLGCDLCDLHEALEIFHTHALHPTAASLRRVALPPPAVKSNGGAAADVYSTLGIDRPLPPGQEEVLGEVLTSFHKLIRHIHDVAAPGSSAAEPGEAPAAAGEERDEGS